MICITSGKIYVKSTFGRFPETYWPLSDIALTQPVVVTSRGRERTVLISTEEYHRLKRRDRQVIAAVDFTDAELEEMAAARFLWKQWLLTMKFKE